jgi:hypothetical protein
MLAINFKHDFRPHVPNASLLGNYITLFDACIKIKAPVGGTLLDAYTRIGSKRLQRSVGVRSDVRLELLLGLGLGLGRSDRFNGNLLLPLRSYVNLSWSLCRRGLYGQGEYVQFTHDVCQELSLGVQLASHGSGFCGQFCEASIVSLCASLQIFDHGSGFRIVRGEFRWGIWDCVAFRLAGIGVRCCRYDDVCARVECSEVVSV